MLFKSIGIALFVVFAACLSIDSSKAHAHAQDPTNKVGLPVYQAGARYSQMPSADIVYGQPPNPSGGLLQSSWWDPNGSDYDQYVWDNFTPESTRVITEVQWRGGYDPGKFGAGGQVIDFTVAIYPSIAAGTQPDVVNPALVEYQTGGNTGETLAGAFGGTTMYDYHFTLPAAFQAAAGIKYWLQIEAWQHGIPDWGMAVGSGGDGKYFRRIANLGDIFYQIAPGDVTFTLLGPPGDSYKICLPLIR